MAKFNRKLIFHETIHFSQTDVVSPFFGITKQTMTLKVWQNKCSLYAKLFVDNDLVSSSSFYEKDGDMSLYRVKEYYGFNNK